MLKFPKLTGLICLLFWINVLSLHAQTDDTCITFEDLPAGAVYGKDGGHAPGDLAFTTKGVNVYLEEFLYSNTNETGFWNTTVDTNIFGSQPAYDGQALFISNINLKFDFTALPQPVNGLCFQIVDGGGEENIAVNGNAIKIVPDLLNLDIQIAAGVTLIITPLPDTDSSSPKNLQICLRGKIETLLIGGQEFAFDNLCVYYAPCPLPEIRAEIVNCLSVSNLLTVYEIELSAGIQSNNDILPFEVFVNGELLGLFRLSDLPLRLKQIQLLNTVELLNVQVCVKNWDCCAEIELSSAGCLKNCSLDEVSIGEIRCSFDGNYYTLIKPQGSNLSGELTITNEAGYTWTGPADGSVPVKFPIPSQHYDKWEICDSKNPDCCLTFDFEVPCDPCRIGPLQVSATECSDDGFFYVRLDFDHVAPTGQFYVFINDVQYTAGAYSNLPLQLGPFKGDGQTGYKILVRDASGLCDQDIYLEPVDCSPAECRIGTLNLSGPECTEDGNFYFKLDFKYENTSERFQVVLNGEVFESYAYADLPVRVGPLPADGTTGWQVLVRDQYGACASDAKFEAVSCQPVQCEIGDLNISGPVCLPGSNQFYFKLDFKYWNTSERFELQINGQPYESYAYADLPVRVGPFTSDAAQVEWKIRVLDTSEKCEGLGVLAGPVCNSGACEIGELDISGPVCQDDGQFYFKLNFKYQHTSDKFQVFLNNEVFETYAYEDLPVRVGPLPADGKTDWLIVVKDVSQNCGREAKLPAVNCNPDACGIGHLKVSPPVCTDASGQFFFKLDFDHKNTSDAFKIVINDELYEQFPYQELPVTVGPLPADGVTDWHIMVQDLSGDCGSDAYLEAVNCNPKECVIGALKLSEPICTDDGQFYFELNFEHKNTSDKFQLLLNQDVYESYSYADLPIKVGPLPANTGKDWQVLVRDLSTSSTNSCASDAKLPAVQCPGGECTIGALKLFDAKCTDDGSQFYIWLNFEHKNTSGFFDLYLGDEISGTYSYSDLPIKIGPLNALIDVDWKLLVKDAKGNCAEDIHFSAPACEGGGDCKLSGLKVERYPCIGGQFLVDLFFDITNPGGSGFYVFTNGKISGPHSYNQPNITLGPFPGDGTTTYDFLVIDIDDPSCYGYYELGPVDCSNPCSISDLKAEAHDCDDEGGFLLDFSFTYDKVGGSGFSVLINGEAYGKFEYGKAFYTVGPLAGDGSTSYKIELFDNDNPDCRSSTVIEAKNCLPPCEIGELSYTVQCLMNATQFILNLDFEYSHPAAERFVLAIGDDIVGTFPYSALPLSKELALPENGKLIVAVWDAENPDCAQKAQFTIPCCYLSEPVVEAHPCENDGELWLDLDLKYHNVSDSFQLVYGIWGGELRTRNFGYDQLPLTLGPLPGQSEEKWYFEVTDLGFYCQSSAYFTPEYCDDDACAGWNETPAGAYGPLTGYQPGDKIDEEDGLQLHFSPANEANCNCSVFLTKASTFPAFQAASGQVVLLDNSAALIASPGYEMLSLSVDYYYSGSEVLLQINGGAIVAAAHPKDLPADIAPGVKLVVTPGSNDGKAGTMTFSGKIYRLSLMSRGKWALDNFCTEKTEKDDEVWPGDTNTDNIANHIDLLNIGLGFGKQGPLRTNANLNWEGQAAVNWPDQFFQDDLNLKHADANGDGVINRADRGAIQENYGLTHGPLPVFSETPATENDPPLYVDFEAVTAPVTVGGTFQAPIVFGTEARPVKDIYGIAFTIRFDPAVIPPSSIEVVYPDSWMGDTDNNLLTIDRTYQELGRIEVAITRIDQINVGGSGPIASLIGAIDDIAGKYTEVSVTEVVAINAGQDRIPVNGRATKVEFSEELRPDIGYIDLNASLNIFPNPTSGEVLVTTRFNFPIERIRVLDGYGNPTGLQVTGRNRINLDALPSGIYMLRIQLGRYTISRKVVKVN